MKVYRDPKYSPTSFGLHQGTDFARFTWMELTLFSDG